jgi:hypothetical protein
MTTPIGNSRSNWPQILSMVTLFPERAASESFDGLIHGAAKAAGVD